MREQTDWDLNLGCLAGAYRATPNESTKMSPNLLTMGREVRLPSELVFGSTTTCGDEEITSYGEYVDVLRSRMQHAHEVARKHLGTAATRSKLIYDAKLALNKYQPGDAVWCLQEVRKLGITPKLERVYGGPYIIKVKLSDVNYVLKLDKSGRERTVHRNKLKPYQGDTSQSFK